MILDVYVLGRRIGTVTREGVSHVFTYLPDTPADHFVSLTMPVRAQSYVWPELHPVLQMNLPEGYLKDTLRRRFGPVATVDDLSLLALTGRRTIGRVQVVPAGTSLIGEDASLDLASLLSSADAQHLFLDYIDQGLAEGVAGVMPKALSAMAGDHDKATAITPEFVVKTGPQDLPGLAINEHLCLLVADRAGVAVPESKLSSDGKVIAIRRFDRQGSTLFGFEDFCALKGLPPYRKYEGSHEDLAKILKNHVSAAYLGVAREQLFRLIVVNHALHNADAHLKNYGLLYTSLDDVRFAPAYDILTIPAYPEFHQDIPGLTLSGKKAWSCGKLLLRYAQEWLDIPPEKARVMVEQVSDAVHAIAPDVKKCAEEYPEFREIAKRMLTYWERGVAGVRPTAKPQPVKSTLRESTGLSDEDRRKKIKANPYKNPDGGFSNKVR